VVAYPAGDRFGCVISEQEIERRANRSGPLKIVFVGNQIPRKNLHILIEALSRLPGGSWECSVAGSDTTDKAYARAVRRQVARLNLERKVLFLGHLAEEALARVLRESQVLAVPSSYEGFGIAYLEGMSFGLPAIASTVGAAGEIILHGQNGFLVDPGDPTAIAGHIKSLLENRSQLVRLSKAALHRFQEHPTWDQSAASIRNFLQTLIRDQT
jgi:glycosyltransferase involved in cell wall biosynthesis